MNKTAVARELVAVAKSLAIGREKTSKYQTKEELLDFASKLIEESQMLAGRSLILWQEIRDNNRDGDLDKAEKEAKALHDLAKKCQSQSMNIAIEWPKS